MVTPSSDCLGASLLNAGEGELVFQVRGSSRDGQIVRLRSPKCTIGSASRCTLRLRARGVRPVHCLILRGAKETVVRRWAPDTRLNGQPFDDASLAPGDCLSIGPIDLVLLDGHRPPKSSFTETTPIPRGELAGSRFQQKPARPAREECSRGAGLDAKDEGLAVANRALRNRARRLLERLREARQMIAQLLKERHQHRSGEGSQQDTSIGEQGAELARRAEALKQREAALAAKREELEQARGRLATEFDEAQSEIDQRRQRLNAQEDQMEAQRVSFDHEREEWQQSKDKEEAELKRLRGELEALAAELNQRQARLDAREKALDTREADLNALERQRHAGDHDVEPPEAACALEAHSPQSPEEVQFEPISADTPVQLWDVLRRTGHIPPPAEYGPPPQDELPQHEEPSGPQPIAGRKSGRSSELTRKISLGGISQTDTEDQEQSIDDYMARLLARVREATDGPAEVEERPATPEEKVKLEDLTPRASAPERLLDLAALRELANLSARSAVDGHAQATLRRLLKDKSLVAVAALVAGAVLIGLWCIRPGLPVPFYAGLLGLLVALVWGIQWAVLKGKLGVSSSGRLEWKGRRRDANPPPGDRAPSNPPPDDKSGQPNSADQQSSSPENHDESPESETVAAESPPPPQEDAERPTQDPSSQPSPDTG